MRVVRTLVALLALAPFAAHGAITFIGAGAADSTANDDAITPGLHASTASGDALIMLIHRGHDAGDGGGLTDGGFAVSGFSQLELVQNAATTAELAVYCRIATGTDPTTFTPPNGTDGTSDMTISVVLTFRGTLNTCSGIVAHTNETTNTGQNGTLSHPSLTITTDNTLLLVAGSKKGISVGGGVSVLTTNSFGWAEAFDDSSLSGEDGSLVADYVVQTTAANLSAGSFTVSGDSSGTTKSIALSILPDSTGGELTGAPTVTAQDTNDYTISGTTDGAVTIYAVACAKDSTAPSIAQVAAGNCTGDVAALAAVNESWNGADSFILGGALPLKIYDLYVTDSTTLYTLADEQLDVAAGYERTILASVDATSPYFGTETAAGDYCDTEAVTSPDAFVVTPETDGTISYAAGGSTARQIILGNCHDLSESDIDSYQFVFNNLTCGLEEDLLDDGPTLLQKDVAIATQESETLCVDPEGDTIDVAVDALPTGLSLVDTPPWQVTGTPTACSEITSEFTWTDEYGADYVESAVYQIGDLIPDVVTGGVDEATAVAAIEAVCSFTATAGTPAYSDTVAEGDVISTDPISGWLSPPDQEVTYVLSLGEAPYPDTWVSYARVWMFREVRRVYLTTTAFKDAVEDDLRGGQVWTRWAPGTNAWSGSSNMQINVIDIPGVPALYDNGAVRP